MWRKLATITMLTLIPLLAACGPGGSDDVPDGDTDTRRAAEPERSAAARPAPVAPAPAASAAAPAPRAQRGNPSGKEPLVVFLGDSLTAGLGLEKDAAYPARVEAVLEEEGLPVRVLNAGVSGDTTAGGLARLDWILKQQPDVLVVGLGGNDGLRGLPLDQTEKNLKEILSRGRQSGAQVLLLGMQIPPNYGEYADRFAEMYPRVARDVEVPLVPFLLEGVGGVAELNQEDGIHPTAKGQEIMAKTVLPYVRPLVAPEERRAVAGAG
jgi:acyl-CoA thioesterase-1